MCENGNDIWYDDQPETLRWELRWECPLPHQFNSFAFRVSWFFRFYPFEPSDQTAEIKSSQPCESERMCAGTHKTIVYVYTSKLIVVCLSAWCVLLRGRNKKTWKKTSIGQRNCREIKRFHFLMKSLFIQFRSPSSHVFLLLIVALEPNELLFAAQTSTPMKRRTVIATINVSQRRRRRRRRKTFPRSANLCKFRILFFFCLGSVRRTTINWRNKPNELKTIKSTIWRFLIIIKCVWCVGEFWGRTNSGGQCTARGEGMACNRTIVRANRMQIKFKCIRIGRNSLVERSVCLVAFFQVRFGNFLSFAWLPVFRRNAMMQMTCSKLKNLFGATGAWWVVISSDDADGLPQF